MSSSPLYLAIVVVWLIVLVPMLLRKDSAETVHEEQRREDDEVDGPEFEEPEEPEDITEDVPDGSEATDRADSRVVDASPDTEPRSEEEASEHWHDGYGRAAREPRARVIARRRRRTSGLTLVSLSTIVAVALGFGPWWVIAPPVLLLVGHMALLREAAKADAERTEAFIRARRRAALQARRAEERRRVAEREAQIFALRARHNQVYDQYADARLRAAGD